MKTLPEMRELAERATDGPWDIQSSPFEVFNVDHCALITEIVSGYTLIGALYNDDINDPTNQFIAASRDFVPAAIQVMEEMRLALQNLLNEAAPQHGRYTQQFTQTKAQIEADIVLAKYAKLAGE